MLSKVYRRVLDGNVVNLLERKCRRCFYKGPDFTKNNYEIQRGNYASLDEVHINFFRNLLGESRMLMDLSDLEKYNVDWMNHLRGMWSIDKYIYCAIASSLVLKPKTSEEVSQILAFCNENKIAVCPQGGNTGVVGGSVPVLDEIILSTELMNQVVSLDEVSGVLVCEAGCILQDLDNRLSEKNLMMPLDIGAKGSCHIGGNVSTNAGGLRLLRYGNLHGNILGLEVVKANGEVLDLLSTLKKDNTGYHLKHLFIGAEGTLGFVTKIAIQCPVKPKSQNLAFLGLQNYSKVLKGFRYAKEQLSEILSAAEVMDSRTMDTVKEHLGLKSPIGEYPFYLLIETSGSREDHDGEKLINFVENALTKHFILNGTVVTEPSKFKDIWSIREKIPDTFRKEGYVFCYDFTLPLDNYYKLVDEIREYMGDRADRVFGFGHLGDGNLHLQISTKNFDPEILVHIEPYIFKRVKEMKGSISSEHGIGFLKAKYLNLIKDANTIQLMKHLKQTLDPNGIMNPYKLFR